MVKSYNSRLLPIKEKGLCGDLERKDPKAQVIKKVKQLSKLFENSRHTVAFTGAGISTSCGIADFRGPNGVWTKELKGERINPQDDTSLCFEKATPSFTHNALVALVNHNKLQHIISQNVDGLHLRSGMCQENLTELHGNIFIETCLKCKTNYFRDFDVGGMGLRPTGNTCDDTHCGGQLVDNAIDWDTPLPEHEFNKANQHLKKCTLLLCLGTSLRIRPAGNLPLKVLKASKDRGDKKGEVVIVNLQSTHLDSKSAIKINHYCDDVMRMLCEMLNVQVVPQISASTENIVTTHSTACDDEITDNLVCNPTNSTTLSKKRTNTASRVNAQKTQNKSDSNSTEIIEVSSKKRRKVANTTLKYVEVDDDVWIQEYW